MNCLAKINLTIGEAFSCGRAYENSIWQPFFWIMTAVACAAIVTVAIKRRTETTQLTQWQALNWIIRRIDRIEDKLNRLHNKVDRNEWFDTERDVILMASIDDVIAKATDAKTVSESTNIAVREVIRLLKEGQAQNDPAKFDQAVALLDAMKADDASMLTDNTPAEPPAP